MLKKCGFTLVEIVITITIVGIIAGVSAKVLLEGLDTYSLVTNRKDALQHARVAMDRMVSELVLVKPLMFTGASDTQVSFTSQSFELVNFRRVYNYSRYEVYRRDDFLAGPLGLLDFDYYRLNGTTASWPWDIRRINIELTIQTFGGYGSIPLRTDIFPRNFMYSNFRE